MNTKCIRVQRHAAAFYVFAKAKTFHFCADNIRSHLARSYPRKNFIHSAHLCRTGVYKGAWESAPLRTSLDGDDVIIKLSLVHLSLTLMPDICL